MNIARTTLSSKVLAQDKDYFSNLAVDAVLRLKVSVPFCVGVSHRLLLMLPQGSTDLDHIQIIKKVGGKLTDSYLDEGWCYFFFFQIVRRCLTAHIGFILDKSIGTNCPKRVENARILIANTCMLFMPMDSRV
jgi:T-complex protein 1 subunit beta